VNGNYKVSVDVPCLELLFVCSRRHRQELVRFLDSPARDPFQRGDYEERGVSGRVYQLKSRRPFMITYWADHARKEVRVVAIRKY
jgi:hypothetical protein